jgi:DNA-binding transcriptional ArsR family regulator
MDSFTALADPTRRHIVEMLSASGQLAAGDIASKFETSAPAISQHLKVLREADLVCMEKRAQQRIYSINEGALDDMQAWINKMRAFWSERLDALEPLLNSEKE